MPICKLTEKSLCPVVNRIWVRVGTIIVNVQYLQLPINVESIPHRHVDKCFLFFVSLARLVPGHCDRMLLLQVVIASFRLSQLLDGICRKRF